MTFRGEPTRSALGASMRSWLGVLFGSYYMPIVVTCQAAAYINDVPTWNNDYARWSAILSQIQSDTPGLQVHDYFKGIDFVGYFKLFAGYHNDRAGGANPPYNSNPIPNQGTDMDQATCRIDWEQRAIKGFGGEADPELDDFKIIYTYYNTAFQRVDARPRLVSFFIQDDAHSTKTDYDNGISDFQDFLDEQGIAWEEELDANCRWMKWLCDYYIEKYNVS